MSTTSPVRVVVADDSALMRNIVTRSLTKAGLEVVGSARDGDEALALCERERPDAMTLDLTMPGLDGLGVLRVLGERTDTHLPRVVAARCARPPTRTFRWWACPLSRTLMARGRWTRSPRAGLTWFPSRPPTRA